MEFCTIPSSEIIKQQINEAKTYLGFDDGPLLSLIGHIDFETWTGTDKNYLHLKTKNDSIISVFIKFNMKLSILNLKEQYIIKTAITATAKSIRLIIKI